MNVMIIEIPKQQHFFAAFWTIDLQALVTLSPFCSNLVLARKQTFSAHWTRGRFTFHSFLVALGTQHVKARQKQWDQEKHHGNENR